jgi:hypothetical protein
MTGPITVRNVRIGIAGWGNPPAQRQERNANDSHLAYYASRFACVEINSSFYKSHQAATYRRWRDDTPPNFGFSVKMPRSITHEAGLRRSQREVRRFYDEISQLRRCYTISRSRVWRLIPPAARAPANPVEWAALPTIAGTAHLAFITHHTPTLNCSCSLRR